MYKTYRILDVYNKMNSMEISPLDIMVTGVTGAGKSTTLNTLFEKDIATVGKGVEPETMELSSYSLNDSLRFWDTPGLGDGISKDKQHSKKIISLLYKSYSSKDIKYGFIDIVLVIIEGSNRDMGTTYKLLNEVIVPNFQKSRILVAINQADVAMKGRNWNSKKKEPEEKLLKFLDDKALSIQKRVREATGVNIIKPIYYSAEYGYNLHKLLDFIIDNIPNKKRNLKVAIPA
ncbi:MAG: GTPase Era [uncultured Thiotrichaceae bacterium]|uniref:GTPase Era n=1 Tax=uncultured Thiotrichaceae bacterium TaxID=298394 RepID=A0A6S6SQB6_9GAMM|nr:MAG: GTPase Era [uncultured Thiotrichaceae bacterium]